MLLDQEEMIGTLTKFVPGKNKYSLIVEGVDQISFDTSIFFRNLIPDNNANCPLTLATTLLKNKILEGESTGVKVTLKNVDTESGLPMAVIIVGLPGGLEVRYKHLKELVEAGTIDCFEVKNREIILYFLEMDKGQTLEFSFDVIASYPGSYTGEASYTYLYYSDEYKHYAAPLEIEIRPQ